MKRWIALPVCAALLLTGLVSCARRDDSSELRAVWISFLEFKAGQDEPAFRAHFDALFEDMAGFGICTVFLHVQPFSDAIWPSDAAPWSHILTGAQGRDPGFDPLMVFAELAERHGLGLHAWFNLLRVSNARGTDMLSENNRALAHIEAEDGLVWQAENGLLFWSPAAPETHTLLLSSIREVLERYPVAGIHIDDYFYPTADPEIDAAQFAQYRAEGGTMALDEWRRENVNALVRNIYRTAKDANPEAVVSISPAANISRNFHELYADAALWMREPGYADWVIPQIYFGFENQHLPFQPTVRGWAELPRHEGLRLFVGLAAYKIGVEDVWAGTGRDEWTEHDDIIARQVEYLRGLKGVEGFALFSSRALFGGELTEFASREREHLQDLLFN